MLVSVKSVVTQGRTFQYLHIVQNCRESGRVRQRIVESPGPLNELQASGARMTGRA